MDTRRERDTRLSSFPYFFTLEGSFNRLPEFGLRNSTLDGYV